MSAAGAQIDTSPVCHATNHAWPNLSSEWRGPSPGYVDCVRVCLDRLTSEALTELKGLLTGDEAARADRFAAFDDRVRALSGRAISRILLARITGLDPPDIAIETGPFGKPFLRGGPEFNLSHGGGVLLFGFTPNQPVGIDVEPAASGSAWHEVVRRLHPSERAALAVAADPDGLFARIWTRKEAVAKSAGIGLSVATGLWAVATEHPAVIVPPPGSDAGAAWSVFDLIPARDHVGAVATQGISVPRCWTFAPYS
jgi:4'-phosphopantetheinyl transferase